jgi:hypothetical protein
MGWAQLLVMGLAAQLVVMGWALQLVMGWAPRPAARGWALQVMGWAQLVVLVMGWALQVVLVMGRAGASSAAAHTSRLSKQCQVPVCYAGYNAAGVF